MRGIHTCFNKNNLPNQLLLIYFLFLKNISITIVKSFFKPLHKYHFDEPSTGESSLSALN